MKLFALVALAFAVASAASLQQNQDQEIMRSARDLIGWNRYRNSVGSISRRKLKAKSFETSTAKDMYAEQLMKFLEKTGRQSEIQKLRMLLRK